MSRIGHVTTGEANGTPGERTSVSATRAALAVPRPQQADPANSTGSLLRGIRIIETLADAPSPLLLVELAERVHLDSSTVYRLVQSLAQEGFVVRLSSKRYVAGPRTLRLLGTYHPVNRFCRDVELVLQQLRDQVGETIMLVLFAGIERVIVKIVQGRESLSQSYETWLRTPLHGSASGKLLLMQMPLQRLRELLGPPPYPAATEFTVTTETALLQALETARANGYAVARDDAFVGMTAIAAPITCHQGALGCLTVVASSARLSRENEDQLGVALRDCANLIINAVPSVRSLAHCLGT